MADIQARKAEHMEVSTTQDVNTRADAGWHDIHLVHDALPELDVHQLDLSTEFLGYRLRYPIVISSMTGGHEQAVKVNRVLARAAQEFGIGMGLGSQRAALKDPSLTRTYSVTRETAPSAMLIANIGAAQLIPQGRTPALTVEQLEQIVAMIGANVLAVHLNFTEEMIQTEGDRQARGCLEAIERVAHAVSVPILGKETGAGLSRPVGERLKQAGVKALDVGGVGGTSFAAVEAIRAERQGDRRGAQLGQLFRDWGIPTAVSVVQVADLGLPVIATGGIRTGLDAAKALALGARLVGVARPVLQQAVEGYDKLAEWLQLFVEELKTATFLTGSASLSELPKAPKVITGATADWLRQLGIPGGLSPAQRLDLRLPEAQQVGLRNL